MNRCTLILLAMILTLSYGKCHGAIADVPAGAGEFSGSGLFRTTTNGSFGSLGIVTRSRTTAVVRLDDLLDVATIVSANSTHRLDFNASATRTFQTGPPNFPNPNPTFVTYTETLSIDTFTVSGPTSLISASQMSPITNGPAFSFASTCSFAFPDYFEFAGVYKIIGPTTTITTPINVRYNRVGSPTIGGVVRGGINVGSNYPATAFVGLSGPIINPLQKTYAPEVTNLFDGVVDGVAYKAFFSNTQLKAFGAVPEPIPFATASLAAIAGMALDRRRRVRSWSRCNS